MRANVNKLALFGLQASLGIILLVEASLLALAPAHIRSFAAMGLHGWIRVVLAWGEMCGALLFLIPRTMMAGGYCLLVIFAFAEVLHFLREGAGVGALVVYAAAVIVVMSRK